MKLIELEPRWLRWEGIEGEFRHDAASIGEANGIIFVCPKCLLEAKMHRPGVHSIICWEPEVPQTIEPIPGRWQMKGTGFDDLTLVAGSSSVLVLGGCAAHFFITNGEIIGC